MEHKMEDAFREALLKRCARFLGLRDIRYLSASDRSVLERIVDDGLAAFDLAASTGIKQYDHFSGDMDAMGGLSSQSERH